MKAMDRIGFLVGVFAFAMAGIYAWWTNSAGYGTEWVGVVGLILGGLLGFMNFFVLMVFRRQLDTDPSDDPLGEIDDIAGEYGQFSPHSWQPLFLAGAGSSSLVRSSPSRPSSAGLSSTGRASTHSECFELTSGPLVTRSPEARSCAGLALRIVPGRRGRAAQEHRDGGMCCSCAPTRGECAASCVERETIVPISAHSGGSWEVKGRPLQKGSGRAQEQGESLPECRCIARVGHLEHLGAGRCAGDHTDVASSKPKGFGDSAAYGGRGSPVNGPCGHGHGEDVPSAITATNARPGGSWANPHGHSHAGDCAIVAAA